MELNKKDLILLGFGLLGSVTGAGNTYYETQVADHTDYRAQIQTLSEDLVNQRIQICLLINEINRLNGADLTSCVPN